MTPSPACPGCGRPLHRVRRPAESMLNDDQFDSVKCGDWFCEDCPKPTGDQRLVGGRRYQYFWTRKLAQVSAPPDSEGPTPITFGKPWAGTQTELTRSLIARLRQPVDYGGYDGWDTDPLHRNAADRIEALEAALLTEREMYNAWRKRAEEAEHFAGAPSREPPPNPARGELS